MIASIIIPNYNGEKFIKNCMESIKSQTITDFEVIIVDNASADDSVKIVEASYPKVKLIKLDKNYGFSRAVNEGIKASSADFVVLLNNDVEVEPDWLENLVDCIQSDKRLFSCSSKMVQYYDRSRIDDAGDFYTLIGWTLKRGDGQAVERYSRKDNIFSSCGGAAIYRKSVFKEIGYFDENFFAYMEDVDISYRAKIYGYANAYCSDAVVYHVGSGTSGSRYNSFKVKLAARNNIYVAHKNMPLMQLILNIPFLVFGYLVKYFFFLRKGLGNGYMEGIREALKNLRKIEKVKYCNKNLLNYVKIEMELIINTLKHIFDKACVAFDRQRG